MNKVPLPTPSLGIAGQVDSLGTKIVLARRPKDFLNLQLMSYSLMSLNFDDSDEYAQAMLRYSLDWANRQPSSISLIPVNRGGALTEQLSKIRRPKIPAKLCGEMPDDGELGLVEILSELLVYARSVESMLTLNKQVYASSKKFDLVILPYFKNDFVEFRSEELLLQLIAISAKCRLSIILFGTTPEVIPNSVLELMDWSGFIGPKSESYARDLFQVNMESPSLTRARIGVSYDRRNNEELQSLHSLSYKATSAEAKRRENLREEVQNYSKFLEGLTDGTSGESK